MAPKKKFPGDPRFSSDAQKIDVDDDVERLRDGRFLTTRLLDYVLKYAASKTKAVTGSRYICCAQTDFHYTMERSNLLMGDQKTTHGIQATRNGGNVLEFLIHPQQLEE